MPRVSVIVPAYNAAAHIADALESVQAQTYRDWEVVVADDGSTDNTGAIASGFGERVRVVRSDRNRGLASARNLAIEHAQGELLALLDSDDRLLPEYLESQIGAYHLARAQATRVGVVACDAFLLRNGDIQATHLERLGRIGDVTVPLLLRFNPIFISALIPRAVLEEVGGFAPELRSAEDLDLWLRIVECGYRVVRNPRALVVYRVGPSQLSAQRGSMAHATRVVYQRALERGRLTPGERRLAARAIRRQRAIARFEAIRADGHRAAPRLARSLPLFAVVAAEAAPRVPRWLWTALARRRGRGAAIQPNGARTAPRA